jgi:hypothetical protein
MGREPSPRSGHLRSHAVRVLVITIIMRFAGSAHADKIDDLNNDLDNDSDRVRLTAVLALTNQQSPRSIPGLIKRMLDTGEKKNIRGLAANALGEIVSKGSPSAAQKKAAIDALTKAKSDPEPFVSAKADAALSTAGASGGGATPTPPGSYQGVYVNVGPFSAKDPAHKAAMKKTAESKLSQLQSSWVQTWAGGGQPTATQLAQKKFAGFYIDGTLESVTVNKSGGGATVTCKVNAYLAEFPSKNIIAPGTGSANVQGGTSARDIELGTQDCVQAVIESLITKRIVPTIKSKI